MTVSDVYVELPFKYEEQDFIRPFQKEYGLYFDSKTGAIWTRCEHLMCPLLYTCLRLSIGWLNGCCLMREAAPVMRSVSGEHVVGWQC